MFSRVRLLLTISIGLLVLAACGDPVPPETGFEVAVTVVGDGNVTSTPAGIKTANAKTSATFAENAEVVLTATPIGNATFTNWTGGACDGSADVVCTIADLTADTAVTANFTEDVEPGVDITYTINVVNGGAASGTVSSSTGLVTDCADSCDDTAPENTTVTLTATVADDAGVSHFAGWTGGDCEGLKSLSCDVTLQDGEAAVTANFNELSTETIDLSEAVEELITGSAGNLATFPPGHNYQLSSDLDVNYDLTHSSQQWIGLRFDFAALPQGASIQSAVIDMVAHANGSDAVNVTLSGEAVAAPAAFEDDADTTASADASTRATNNGTAATVAWAITDAWTADDAVQSPDITPIVQEVVSLEGWGGSLVVFVSPETDETSTTTRRIRNPLDEPTAPMTITVEYVALPAVI